MLLLRAFDYAVKALGHARHINPSLSPPPAASLLKQAILWAYAWSLISAVRAQALINRLALWSA